MTKKKRSKSSVSVSRTAGVQFKDEPYNEQDLVKQTEYCQEDIEKMEPIIETEPETSVTQPFEDPNVSISQPEDLPDSNTETYIPTSIDIELGKAIEQLPPPLINPTQRQYGEQFLPAYTKAYSKLRRLAGL